MKKIGIDIGSTTVKVVVSDENANILYRSYERHFSETRERTIRSLRNAAEALPELVGERVEVALTGSAGLGVAKSAKLPFVQEVYATAAAVNRFYPNADAVIELGGEDAKIIFFGSALEERMNGSCAGGTGAFIDQMATLMDITVAELDTLSLNYEKIYPIASRCGVFAKSDIQPIINQGGRKEDVAASIYQAVVDQTVGGLAQGRELSGTIVFLGGPLTFSQGLRTRFTETLCLTSEEAVFPANAEVFAAIGAALRASETMDFSEILTSLRNSAGEDLSVDTLAPLFESQAEYDAFSERHAKANIETEDLTAYSGGAFLGVDAGSTTTKAALITPQGKLLYQYYAENKGNPVKVIIAVLTEIYALIGNRVSILGSAVTGYGEDLIKSAFKFDYGVVETVAHLTAAKKFQPNVDFLIDIGGQDMKCFKIRGGAVDGILLNEACSSGCGSFISSFAKVLGYDAAEFAALGLFASAPADLGSRCTVFMNSSVKQAQKDGASVNSISAGLSISVVKNAIYKVIRAANADELGENIVVQGGTFLNDAVLRGFETEIGSEVTRPVIAGLMGAYGAALYASEYRGAENVSSAVITPEELSAFTHTAKPAVCGGCTNKCSLTINTFGDGRRFISGNRCGKPIQGEKSELPNMFARKLKRLTQPGLTARKASADRGKIGLPFGLNMLENLPFWREFFTSLGFDVVVSPASSRALYRDGQKTIPSDTVCYPAKLLHGHIEWLARELGDNGVIFYPCGSYNFDEGRGDNHYNCPVVAYYPELLRANMPILRGMRFLTPYTGQHRPKALAKRLSALMRQEFDIPERETANAVKAAFAAYEQYRGDIVSEGKRCVAEARAKGVPIIVLAGRPYHVDPEICHGIDELITSLGLAVITEDAICGFADGKEARSVLNQWTFQARMYDAARYAATQPDMEFVQLVSFGCGTDAITTDELRDIMAARGRLFTSVKIDEITNLGAVKIRLRSLIAARNSRQLKGEVSAYAA
ncbi:MAG: acyl-CoA dehydratase activase-related protein [Oscillospiraceae bacterium]|jgi:predicted CoA-substrate-specific enzyme activase|nr:acyl-CoA dehydratase activase-related protein [Oscillospiraceae bacterium]MDR2360321.1 acyl-CoA dehydratase activase-related protein [Oscillospiraceae bacterium]